MPFELYIDDILIFFVNALASLLQDVLRVFLECTEGKDDSWCGIAFCPLVTPVAKRCSILYTQDLLQLCIPRFVPLLQFFYHRTVISGTGRRNQRWAHCSANVRRFLQMRCSFLLKNGDAIDFFKTVDEYSMLIHCTARCCSQTTSTSGASMG